MNSYWMEHQARQHFTELAADAHGDQLRQEVRASEPVPEDPSILVRPPRYPWLRALAARSRREVGRAAR